MSRQMKTALTLAVVVLLAMQSRPAGAVFTVELTRFGGCLGAGCVIEIPDNSALDAHPAPDVINFNVS